MGNNYDKKIKFSIFCLLLDMSSLNNLAITSTNAAMTSMIGGAWNYLQSRLANGGRDTNCKFYYNDGAGGSVLQVVARSVTGGFVSDLKNMTENAFNSLLNGKKKTSQQSTAWIDSELKKQDLEKEKYGKFKTDEGTLYALDDWGCICPDALMMAVETDHKIRYVQKYPNYAPEPSTSKAWENSREITNTVDTNWLIWYDTTALITTNSDKNLISTRVQGRDYSRKELVSNGDIKFSVSGQITSGRPDLYPTEEIAKFLKVMQYKGIVRINNQVLDQFGITHIVITDYSLTPKEGFKSLQQYTFNAIGLQPETEIEITEDTVEILAQPAPETLSDDGNAWLDMLKNQVDGLKSMAKDAVSQGLAISTGLLDNVL